MKMKKTVKGISSKQKTRLNKILEKLNRVVEEEVYLSEVGLNLLIKQLTDGEASDVKTLTMEHADHLIKYLERFDPDKVHEVVIDCTSE